MQFNAKRYIIDVLIVIGLSALGGFFIGFFGAFTSMSDEQKMMLIALSNIISLLAGFWIVGCINKTGEASRFKYLAYVMLAVWLFGLINVALFGFPFSQWVASGIVVAVLGFLGGGLSFLTCKAIENKKEENIEQ
ncbi:MAG: hypothetical protein PHI79_03355 [Sulfurovaceae bacterium]|nr:hypothetical protein [Sulfurovaceae bacterium]MDD5548618.1 hypothetical protein [Sulfurovaceae bacterium]